MDHRPSSIVHLESTRGAGRAGSGQDRRDSVIGLVIRGTLAEMYGEDVAQAIRVQYGGSVKPENIAGFMEQPEIDGALVGGASLKPDAFAEIVRITAKVLARGS